MQHIVIQQEQEQPVAGVVTLDGSGNGTVTIATPQNTTVAIDVVLTLVSITNPATTCSTVLSNTSTVVVNPNPDVTSLTNNTDICAMDDAVFTLVGTVSTDVAYSYTVGTGAAVAGVVTLDGSGNGTVTIATPQNTTASYRCNTYIGQYYESCNDLQYRIK